MNQSYMEAVITADIVSSTVLEEAAFKKLILAIQELYNNGDNRIEFYRGDSFQVLMMNAQNALKQTILCRLLTIQFSTKKYRIDVRHSISIGKTKKVERNLGAHVDDTFIKSGRALDELIDNNYLGNLSITCGDQQIDFTFDLIAHYTDHLINHVTPAQANIVYQIIAGKTQTQIASDSNKAKPTVNKMAKAAEIDKFLYVLEKYEKLTDSIQHA